MSTPLPRAAPHRVQPYVPLRLACCGGQGEDVDVRPLPVSRVGFVSHHSCGGDAGFRRERFDVGSLCGVLVEYVRECTV